MKHMRGNEVEEDDHNTVAIKTDKCVPPKKKMRPCQPLSHKHQSIDLNNMGVAIYEVGSIYGNDAICILATELFHVAVKYFESSPDDSKTPLQSLTENQPANSKHDYYEKLAEKWREKMLFLTGQVHEKACSKQYSCISNVTTEKTLSYELFREVQFDQGTQLFSHPLCMKESDKDRSANADCHAIALYNMGIAHHRNRNYDCSMCLFQKALSVLDVPNPNGSLDSLRKKTEMCASTLLAMAILNNIGQLKFQKGMHEDALAIFLNSLQIGKKMLKNGSTARMEQNQIDSVSELHMQNLKLHDLRLCVATILSNIARVNFRTGEIDNAIRFCKEMVNAKRDAFGEDHLGIAVAFYNSAICHESINPEEALKLFHAFVRLAKTTCKNDRSFIVSALNKIVLIEHGMGMCNENLVIYHEALSEQIDELGFDHPNVSAIVNQIGSLHSQCNDHEIALECYRERLRVQRDVLYDSQDAIALTLANIGQAYQHLSLYNHATHFYLEAVCMMKSSSSNLVVPFCTNIMINVSMMKQY